MACTAFKAPESALLKKTIKYQILVITYVLGSYLPSFSQAKSEQDLLKQGNKFFYENNYSSANSYFLQLLSLNQTNAEYNYKYGTCLLFSDGDKNKPLKYLLFAVTKGGELDKEAYFYAAKALHLNYRFGEAIKYYQKYASMASDKDREKFQVTRQIEMCNNGKKLLRNVTDLVVVSKKDYREADFFRLYRAEDIEGKILVAEDLQSSTDKKRDHRVIINLPRTSDIVYYSSYGDDGKSLDIYRVKRLPGATWSKPQLVKGSVNTPYDEDYPYLHPDGRSLYFCSKGHNSMGGYDVFKSVMDPETETFGPPENMDFAVNTPDDDILYILDSLEKSAHFASKRESGIGKVHVYNVRVERLPVLIAILKGRFVNEVKPGSNGVTITVVDMQTQEAVGIFNSKSNTGEYLISLDRSGKYKYLVKPETGPEVYEALVTVPYQKELRPLKQEIALVNKDGKDEVVIRNMFDQEIEGADEIIAEVLKNKASLNPNAENISDSALAAIKDKYAKDSVVDVSLNENLTNEDLIKMAKEQAENQQKEADELKEKLEAAYNVAAQKTNDARDKAKEAENNIAQGDEIVDPLEKGMLYDEAKKLNDEADKNSKEAVIALNLAKSLEQQHKKAKEDAEVAKKYSDGIEKAINSKNKDEAIKQLKEQQAYIKELMSSNAAEEDLYAETKKKAGDKKEEARNALNAADKYKQAESELLSDISNLKREAQNAKGKKKEDLEAQIKQLEGDLAGVQKKKQDAFDKSNTLTKEADQLDSQAEMLADIFENPDVNPSKILTQAEKDQLAQNIQSDAKNIKGNNERIEQKIQVDRQKKFDYNDFLAKYDYYANMFNEYERLKRNLLTPDDYDKLINHNESWINEIDNDLSNVEKEEKTTSDENKKKQLAAKREELKRLKQFKEQENKDLRIEKQKLIDRLSKNNNTNDKTNENLLAMEDNSVKDAAQKNQDKINEINNSGKTDVRKATERNKANKELVESLDEQIDREKKILATSDNEDEKTKSRNKLKVLEEAKDSKQKEIAENNEVIKKENNNTLAIDESVTDQVKKNRSLRENTDIDNQVKKTNQLKEDLGDLVAKRSECKDQQERNTLDKQIKDKSEELYKEEEKLANNVKNSNDKLYTEEKTETDKKLKESNLDEPGKKKVNDLLIESDTDMKAAKKLYEDASKEKDPVKKNQLLEEAVEKQNSAIDKQENAQDIIRESGKNQLPTVDSTPLTEEREKQLITSIDNTFDTKEKAINNSDKTEAEKAKELKNLNEDLVNKIETEIKNLQNANTGNLAEAEKKQNTEKINELEKLLPEVRKEISELDKQANNVLATNNNQSSYDKNPANYNNPDAQKDYASIKNKVDDIKKQQENIDQQKTKLASTTDANEKQQIEKDIANQEKELVKKELAVAPTFEKINAAEIKQNQDRINGITAKINPDELNDEQKDRYNKAQQFIKQANQNLEEASKLRQQAQGEKDENRKNELLKKANELETDAIKDQQEAKKMLDILLDEYTVAHNRNTPHNNTSADSEKDKELIAEVNPEYTNKLEALKNSDKSEARKTYEENELNKELVNNLENEIAKLQQQDPEKLTEEEKKKRRLKIEELNRLLDAKQKELGITEAKLKENNIIDNKNENHQDYSSTLIAQNKDAIAEKQKIDNALNEIEKSKNNLAENRLKANETTDNKEKEKLDKEAGNINKTITQKEIGIAPAIDRVNMLEYNSHKNNLAQQQLKLAENNITIPAETEKEIEQLVNNAETLNREADALREQANKEKDNEKKNDLLKLAHAKEIEAIRSITKAEQLLDNAKEKQNNTASINEKNNNDLVAESVDKNYNESIKEIENSGETPLQKTQRKEELNEELVSKIKTEINLLENDLSRQSAEEQKRRRMRLEELNRLLDQKEKELNAQKQLLASNGVKDNGSQTISYTDPYTPESYQSKALQIEAKQRIEELKREELKLKNAQVKLAESNTPADKTKFQNEIKSQEKIVTEKELAVAKVFADINQLEIAKNKEELGKLQSRVIGNSDIDKNSEKVREADNKVNTANQKLVEASDLRNQAAKENDKTKKNELLKKAFALEKEAIDEQNKAEAIYENILGGVDLNTAGNNGNNAKKEIIIPENIAERPSSRELQKYEALNNRANFLEQRYKTVSDSAQTVKKKNRPEVLAMADQLKKESEIARTEANLAKNNYEKLKQQEDEQLLAQQKRKEEQENAKQLEPEVVKMNEYANYYNLQKDANTIKEQIDRKSNTENQLRNSISEEKAEAYNLKQDAEKETDPARKTELNNKANALDLAVAQKQRKADSLAGANRNLEPQYNEKQKRADDFLATVDPIKADKIRKVVGENKTNLVRPEVSYVANNNTTIDNPVEFAKNFKAPNEVKNDIYVKSNTAAYSNANPIPINTAKPKGIYFKVQVGAFRNPIPQDLFKEFVPITGETTNNGITRYTVGYFTQFKTADDAKREIRGFGEMYKDAFVVGFKDGERISVAEALRLLGEQQQLANNGNNNQNTNGNTNQNNGQNTNGNTNQNTNGNTNQNTNGNTNGNTNQNNGQTNANNTRPNIDINNAGNEFNNFTADNNKTNYYNDNPNAAKANQVEGIKGLFYTVQVGVYSKPVSLDKIYNIQPLNSELTATRKIRYTTGIYNNIENATTRKDQARAAGITDAFVTAYFNGKRITMEEARQLLEKYGNTIYADARNLTGNGNTVNTNGNGNTNNTNGNTNTNPNNGNNGNNTNQNNGNNNQNNTTENTSGVYTVILGEYAGDVPSKDAEIFLKNNNSYKIMKTNRNGKSTYFVETGGGKPEADKINNYFKSQGLTKTNIINSKLTGELANNEIKVLEPKKQNDLKFQVYLGEYVDEVPEDDAMIYLNNVDKGVKRKTTTDGFTIYYTCDCASYDDALQMKAHFIQEGITSIRIVPFLNQNEISMGEAFKLIYE